jgi:hypothetical protein
MHSAIRTTHAIPQNLPSGCVLSVTASVTVRCNYCMAVLGHAYDRQSRAKLEAAHKCKEKRQAKKPAAPLPFN